MDYGLWFNYKWLNSMDYGLWFNYKWLNSMGLWFMVEL